MTCPSIKEPLRAWINWLEHCQQCRHQAVAVRAVPIWCQQHESTVGKTEHGDLPKFGESLFQKPDSVTLPLHVVTDTNV
jgi:hypothetical protein